MDNFKCVISTKMIHKSSCITGTAHFLLYFLIIRPFHIFVNSLTKKVDTNCVQSVGLIPTGNPSYPI